MTTKTPLILLVLILASCTPTNTEQTLDALPLAKPSDIVTLNNGDSYTLTAELVKKNINGKTYAMMGYNGQIPGPRFVLQKNSHVTITFVNHLTEPTTVHWHGLRHDVKDDGVPGTSQTEVQPGETYTYTLRVPDSGTFWYHPHVREDKQQDLGLYGLLVVTDNALVPANKEEFIILDDLLLEHNQILPYGQTSPNYALMGRYGNTYFINGEPAYTLSVNNGDVVRFTFASASNARPYNLRIPNAQMKLVSTDLSKYEQEQYINNVIIHPGERYTVDVSFDNPGTFELTHTTPYGTYVIGTITVGSTPSTISYAEQFNTLSEHEQVKRDIHRYEPHFSKEPDFTLELTIDMNHDMMRMPSMNSMPEHMADNDAMMGSDNIEWEDTMPMMNSQSTTNFVTWIMRDNQTGNENMNINWTARVGDVKKIRVYNTPNSMHPMHHPLHLHGQRILVLAIDGKPTENLAWKDTFAVPVGSTVDILVEFTQPGTWMFHCHIAEHLHAGMMTGIEVTE